MFSKKEFLYHFQYSSVIIKKFSYVPFNLTMDQQMLGWQDFTNLMFSINLGRFEKRLRTTALRCISASSWGPSFFCIKNFFGPFSLMLHTDSFPFSSVTNITKMKRLHRAASHAISSCLSPSPIQLLLSTSAYKPP